MMHFKDCLSQSHWAEVRVALMRLFPDYAERMESYQTAYEELRRLEPISSNTRFTIGRYEPHGIIPFYVVGFDGDCPKGFCLKFSSWKKWLGASVDPELHSQYQLSEIVAICLQDMTWAGFSSHDVLSFRKEFIHNEDCLWAVYAYAEDIELSEFNLIKRKQRSNEFYEALNLYDLDYDLTFGNESAEYRQARFDVEVQVYCLGESETDYDNYCAKVSTLREDFQLKWPDPSRRRASEH